MEDTLFVIPARGGSKGIPKKNIKLLGGNPLIQYALETARNFTSDENICVTTDNDEIIEVLKLFNYSVPFKRPDLLASDTAGTYEVLLHALDFYKQMGRNYMKLILLQPTSPFRKPIHVEEANQLFSIELDMVVSVKESHANPYFSLVEEDENGYIQKSKPSTFSRRQDAPNVYEYNGAVYIINVTSLRKSPLSAFTKVKKYVMDDIHSLDLDNPLDWEFCEFLLEKKYV